MSWKVRALQAVGGVFVGLVLTEAAFWWRDDGAFPHVAIYLEDAELGARLQPDAHQRIAFGGNPTTTFHTNALGYRGPEPDGDPDTVLVVGDSQVFGLGVEDDQTLAARLAEELGKPVLNGGVPTYGPDEYLAVVEEMAARQPLGTVVLVLNFANDLFEIDRPNRERHAIWDGWAVRSETAPASTVAFPGRAWLYGRSHAFFALRKALYAPDPAGEQGLPSEGTVRDVVVRSQATREALSAREQRVAAELADSTARYQEALAELGDQNALVELYTSMMSDDDEDAGLALQAAVNGANVGDIVRDGYAEASRSIRVTAELLEQGARIRRDLRRQLRKAVQERPWYQASVDAALAGSVAAIEPELAQQRVLDAVVPTPWDGVLDRFHALAVEHDFEPVVVALPLDVMVLPSQLAKYGAEPRDLSETHVLLEDLGRAARERGIRDAQPLEALQEVGDAAFLDGDLHLSALGQDTVAGVVAASLRSRAPARRPSPGIAEGRSRIPWDPEWAAAREINVRRSTVNHCQTRRIREWFRMDCWDGWVTGLRLVDVPQETVAAWDGGRALLLAPVLPDRPVEVDVIWRDRTERFAIRWASGEPTFAFRERGPVVEPQAGRRREVDIELLAVGSRVLQHAQWLGAGASCPDDVACLLGARTALPACPEDQANAGSAGHCFALCNEGRPCEAGVCTPWNGGAVCL